MLIEVRCPNGHVLHVKEKHAGKMGTCPHCSAPVRVPLAGEAYRDDTPEAHSIHQSPAEKLVHEEPEDGHPGKTSDSSMFLGHDKRCIWCGKIVSHASGKCNWCGTPMSNYRHLAVQQEGEVIVVQLNTHQILDERTAKEVSEELLDVANREGSRNLVLSLSKVFSLSSLMLGRLVMLQKKMEQERRQLTLCHVSAEIREVLAATKLDHILHIKEG
ncbi:MAG: STAS domain-containing protein [Thermoguttaceae bacterium]